MPQSYWESETIEEQPPEHLLEPEQQYQEPPPPEQFVETEALALSLDDFSALEERILRAVELVKRERLARAAAEEHAIHAEAQLREQAPRFEQLQNEVNALRAERDHVRQRVERLLAQLDAIEV